MLSTKRSEQGNLYECNVEQGCTATFVKFGNLINHIVVGKHRRVIEKIVFERYDDENVSLQIRGDRKPTNNIPRYELNRYDRRRNKSPF